MPDLIDAKAIRAGQYVRCARCGRWAGPSDPAWLPAEGDAVLCGACVTGSEFEPGKMCHARDDGVDRSD